MDEVAKSPAVSTEVGRCQGRILDEVCSVRDTCAHYLSASTTYLLPTRVGWLCPSHKPIGDA